MRPAATRASGAVVVLHVIGRLSPDGGVQVVVRRLIDHADPALVDLRVLSVRPRLAEDRLDELPVPVVGIGHARPGFRPIDRLRVLIAVARHARRERPEVVHVHSGLAWVGLGARAALPGVPLVLEVHDAPGSGRHGRRSDRFEGWMARRLRATCICHSGSVEADLAREWHLPADQVVTFPLGVDTAMFAPTDPGPRRAGDPFVVAAVGRMVPSKRFDLALDVVAGLVATGVDARLLLVGDGPEREGLAASADRLGVAERVTWCGRRVGAELAATIAGADALVSTSAYEGFGLTITEAMACGLPVVAMAVGGVTDLVEDGVTGALVPPGDVEAMTAALAALAADPALAARRGAAARRAATERFSAAAVAAAFTDVYRRLGGRESARSR